MPMSRQVLAQRGQEAAWTLNRTPHRLTAGGMAGSSRGAAVSVGIAAAV